MTIWITWVTPRSSGTEPEAWVGVGAERRTAAARRRRKAFSRHMLCSILYSDF